MDTGATRTVIGRRQAVAYSNLSGVPLRGPPSQPVSYLFGGVLTPCSGTVDIRVPIAPAAYADLRVAIVELNIPFLFGLDALDAVSFYVNNVENMLKCDARGVATPLKRKDGHLYLEWNKAIHYTTTELDRLHRHFNHPRTGRLAAVLRQAGGVKVTPDMQEELNKIAASCDICQRLAMAPGRFRTALPAEDLAFNRTVYLDLMYLDGKSVLHVVDRDTAFSAAAFTRTEQTDALWLLYCSIWAHPYVGHPSFMHADQGPQFKSAAWKALASSAGIELLLSGIESHNALGTGERYHAFLRSIYRRVRMEHPTVPADGALSLAVSALNQTAGPRGLVPVLLVFGVLPRTPITPLPLPVQRERMAAAVTARKEMRAHVSKARVTMALKSPVPAAAGRAVAPGEKVLVYREPPVDEWVGPYAVVMQQDKTVWLAIDGHLKQFAVDKIKPFVEPTPKPVVQGESDGVTAGPHATSPIPPTPPTESTVPSTTEVPKVPTPTVPVPARSSSEAPPTAALDDDDLGRLLDSVIAGDALLATVHRGCQAFVSHLAPAFVATPSDAERGRTSEHVTPTRFTARAATVPINAQPAPIRLNKVIPAGDPRLTTTPFRDAALKEVAGLRDRGTFTTVRDADVPAGANVIGGRFVYTLKNVNTPEELAKARFVAQGHRDKAKWFVVHNLATMRQRSTRLLVSTAANMRWRIFAHDITQAYLQSRDAFTRQLYLRPLPADRHLFDINEKQLLKLDLPLYGVCDAGDYWDATLCAHVEGDLGMVPLTSDPALYAKRQPDGELSGLLGAYVDDCLMGGDRSFEGLTQKTLTRFQGKDRTLDDAEFVGVHVTTVGGEAPHFAIDQLAYVDHLQRLASDATFAAFLSARASVAWLAHTRPDLCCGINLAAQVTELKYGAAAVRSLNALMGRAQRGRDLALAYHPLDVKCLRVRAYADASYATNSDGSSQIGYLILLCDGSGRAHILSDASRKCRRVVHSIMAGEVYAFSAAFDEAFVIRYDLERIYRQRIPLNLFTDSKQLFDVVTKASHPTEKRLMVDVAAARQAYNRQDLSNVGLIATDNNIADALTKVRGCGALDALLRTGVDRTPVVQWVIRPPLGPPCATTGKAAV